ncbi:unnamed protein product [Periconia digitata]|uniref:Uncharacterized protein n=1 Tax=Periconia digitata TaxID=1303443 RepID=A0A9W4UUZ6_9PLEO|nr:unnamed protein product [Periconia digitata]
MGNAQSSPRSRSHNKLAKPRTISNVVVRGQKNESQQSSLASRYANLSANDRQQIKSQLLSPLETDFENSSALGDDSKLHVIEDATAPTSATSGGMQRGLSNSSRTNSMSCFGSRGGSASKLNSVAGSKVSLHDAVDVETAMRILEEVKRTASPEDLATLQLALQPSPPSPSPRPTSTIDPVINRRNSIALNRSSSSLIRRRSLVTTPGLATRGSPATKDRRAWSSWKTPNLDPQEEAKWHTDKPLANSHTGLAALALTEEQTGASSPRAMTPGDKEYTHLGSLQLGSLRIANGEPSPAPRGALQSLSKEVDYFTPPDVEDAPIMMKPTKRSKHARSMSATIPPTPPLYRKLRLSTASRKSKTLSRCDSPQKTDGSSKPDSVPKAEDASHPQFMNGDDEPEPLRRLRVTNRSSETLATMATHCQANAMDECSHEQLDIDEGFVSDDDKAEKETHTILNGTIFGEPLTTIHSSPLENLSTTQLPAVSPATYEDVIPTIELPELETRSARPPPTKADSGYSSVGSFVMVQRQAMREGSPTLLEEDAHQNSSGDHAREPDATEHAPQTLHRIRSNQENRTTRSDSLDIPRSGSQPQPEQVTGPESPRSPMSLQSEGSAEKNTSMSRRLQKRRPSQQELPGVNPLVHTYESTIPEVPSDLRSQFVTRTSKTSGMEFHNQNHLASEHVQQGERRYEAGVPAPTQAPEETESHTKQQKPEKAERKRWSLFEDSRTGEMAENHGRTHSNSVPDRPQTPSRGLRRSLSLFRSKSKSEKDKAKSAQEYVNEMPMMVDLGAIGSALGRSPYDAAINAAFTHTVTSPTHPHQMGNVMPMSRTKSMVNMDDRTAADYARARSKDRAQARPEMPQRPKSYHQALHHGNDGGRPRSFHYDNDIPPIPTLHAMPPRPRSCHQPSYDGRARSRGFYYDSDIPPVPMLPRSKTPTHTPTAPSAADPSPVQPARPGPQIRARPTGRGPTVSKIVTQYDQYGDWEPRRTEWQVKSHTQQGRRRNYTVGSRPASYQAYQPQLQQQQYQSHYEYQPQYQQQERQQRPRQRSSSSYGRHSLPSQSPHREYRRSSEYVDSAPVPVPVPAMPLHHPQQTQQLQSMGTRQLHSYSSRSMGSRHHSSGY